MTTQRLHLTTRHTGKMAGMQSLSTSCMSNDLCRQRARVKGSICAKCYAERMQRQYKNLRNCLERNTEILTSSVLATEELPLINSCYFRFESFGELNNTTQVQNYFNICKKNPDVHFALWTKNPQFVEPIAEQKPKNLQIILSSLMLNKPADDSKYPFVDKVFTVYDKEHIDKGGININCGAKNCLKCHKCYKKSKVKHIREKLK